MEINDVTYAIRGAAFKVHRALGPGLLESVYENCLAYELEQSGLSVSRQIDLPIQYGGTELLAGYRLDLLVEDKVIVEIKSVETLKPVHQAQLLTYMRLSGKPIGLLINFYVSNLQQGIKRYRMDKCM